MTFLYRCQSIDRAMAVLMILEESPRPLALCEIAEAIALHKSTTHRFIHVLERHGLIQQSGKGLWRLGSRLALFAEAAASRGPVQRRLDQAFDMIARANTVSILSLDEMQAVVHRALKGEFDNLVAATHRAPRKEVTP